jgi:neutral ceramidase
MTRFNRLFRILRITLLVILSLLILFIVVAVAPVNREPVSELPLYNQMMQRIDSIAIPNQDGQAPIKTGFSKISLVPIQRTATAGYARRRGKEFTSVHDSIFVRTLIMDNGITRVAIVTADLLIVPPTVTAILTRKLPETGFSIDNTYLGATHTHNSIGNWAEGAGGFIYGDYEDSIVQFISDAIIKSIVAASAELKPSIIKIGEIAVPAIVTNRLIDDGPEDPLLRLIDITQNDSTRLLFSSYTAHATCLFSRNMELSADYPGKLVSKLEEAEYDFAMFMAGAVGSHKSEVAAAGWPCVDEMAAKLSDEIVASKNALTTVTGNELFMVRVPLLLPEPQVKIAAEWKVRAWLFRKAFHEYPASITGLKIGNIVMLGAPCDFSGEFNFHLDSLARNANNHLIVTSFNGGYIGYATPAKYFDVDHYETQLMNWYPPGNGDYISDCFSRMIGVMTKHP